MAEPMSLAASVSALIISKDFVLDFLASARRDTDPIDTLLLLGILESNVAPFAGRSDLQLKYGSVSTPIPDDLRRPVSIAALSGMLGIPFETTRRRVHRLSERGLCVTSPSGLMVPTRSLLSDAYRDTLEAADRALRDTYFRLKAVGLFDDAPLPPPIPGAGAPMLRASYRIAGDFFLRMMEVLRNATPDVLDALILMQILRMNVEALGDDRTRFLTSGGTPFVPDDLKVPAPLPAITAALRLDRETVRRRTHRLVAEGRCLRTPQGLVTPASLLATPKLVGTLPTNDMNLRRLFRTLAEIGCVQAWETAQAAAA